jgi:hypothetical protein
MTIDEKSYVIDFLASQASRFNNSERFLEKSSV